MSDEIKNTETEEEKTETAEVKAEESEAAAEEKSEDKPEEAAEEKTEETPEEKPEETGTAEAEASEETSKKVNISSKIIAVLGCVVAIAAIALLVIFLLPNNRIKRYMNAADKAYVEGSFDKALNYYGKAEKIDGENYKAVKGKLLSMAALGDEKAEEAAIEALVNISERTNAFTDEEKTDCEEVYLVAADLLKDYENKGPMYCAKMDAVYETLGAPGTLRAALSDSCFKYANTLNDTGNDGHIKLEVLKRGYGVSASDLIREAAVKVSVSLTDEAVSRDDFAEAESLVSDTAAFFGVDNTEEAVKVQTAKNLYETKNRLMGDVYDAMKAYYDASKDSFSEEKAKGNEGLNFGMLAWDWIDMQTIDGSDDAQLLSSNCVNGRLLWAPEGFTENYTGLACGLYTYGDVITDEAGVQWVSYYFFFGEYKNGVRDGYGVSFIKIKDTSFYGFEGMYKDDNPEGFGVYYKKNTYAYTSLAEYTEVCFSDYIEGYQDGTATVRVSLNEQPGTYYEGTYEVAKGEPKEVPSKTEQYELLNEIPEGYVLIGVLPNITDGFDNFMIYRNPVGSKKGAIGYE